MNNTLTDLNNYLFETLERLTDDELTDEQLKREIARSHAVTAVADKVIRNGELSLNVMKHIEDHDYDHEKGKKLPPMLEAK